MRQSNAASVNTNPQENKDTFPAQPGHRWQQAPLTLAFLLITAVGAVLQALIPGYFAALRRDPAALAAGQWWRVVSPLVALDGTLWLHFAYDALGFLLVGVVVEQTMVRGRWLLLFWAAAVTGTIAGYAWDPSGAGASIALCGLIGGLVVWQITRNDFHLIASMYTLVLAAALAVEAVAAAFTSTTLLGILITAIACALLINLLLGLRRRMPDKPASAAYVGAVVFVSALILTALRDLHGVALLTGLMVAALLLWGSRKASRPASLPPPLL